MGLSLVLIILDLESKRRKSAAEEGNQKASYKYILLKDIGARQ